MFELKNVLIYGYGRSGVEVEKILLKLNINYKIIDKKNYIKSSRFIKSLRGIYKNFDLVIMSPGVSIYNKDICKLKKLGIKVIGELEFGFAFCTSNLIAVTGTNGKTSTVSLINKILSSTYQSVALGNIGTPFSSCYNKQYDQIVCEVSSFQLETVELFKPNIAVLLNIAEDHIDRHKTYENYILAKFNIFKNMKKDDISILNFDDFEIMKRISKIKSKIYYISKEKKVEGVYLCNNNIIYNHCGKEEIIFNVTENQGINLSYIYNYMASILVAKLLDIPNEKIVDNIKNFVISPHRQQLIASINGVNYIDDSKATNVHSVVNACENYKQIILLLGGYDKKLDFIDIVNLKNKIKQIIVFGAIRKKLYKFFVQHNIKVFSYKHLSQAVEKAVGIASFGDTILLSPACSSFDEFKSYVDRGNKFKDYVIQYGGEK